MYTEAEIKLIASCLNSKEFTFIESYFENQKETLIKKTKDPVDRNYVAGRLGEIIEILSWIDQRREDYKNVPKKG
jgi:hypothetical protein